MQLTTPRYAFGFLLLVTGKALSAQIESHSTEASFTYARAIDQGDSLQAEVELAPSVELALSPNLFFTASARVRLDAKDELEPGRGSSDSYSKASRPIELGDSGSAEIRDFYLEYRSENGRIRVGKQQIVWGRLDGIKVLDLVNPQDFREFINDDFSNSRIGLWSTYFDYSFGKWRAELAVVPDGTGHAIPDRGAWYELSAPRFRLGAPPDQNPVPVTHSRPGLTLADTAVGLRLSRQFGNIDVSTVAYTGLDPEPLGRVVNAAGRASVEQYYERRETLGLSFDLAFGPAVVRAEYAYHPNRVFNVRSNQQLSNAELDQHRGAIGVDVNGPFDVFINAQYLVDKVIDEPGGLVRPDTDRIGTLYLRRTFDYDNLALEARWYRSFTDNDQQVTVKLNYSISDSTSVQLGAYFSRGTANGLFGQFASRDRVALSLSHIF